MGNVAMVMAAEASTAVLLIALESAANARLLRSELALCESPHCASFDEIRSQMLGHVIRVDIVQPPKARYLPIWPPADEQRTVMACEKHE
jgi:hypothetical protein